MKLGWRDNLTLAMLEVKWLFSLAAKFALGCFLVGLVWLVPSLFLLPSTVQDLTAGESSICEVHGLAMKPKTVKVAYGHKPPKGFLIATRAEREELFPHSTVPRWGGCCYKGGRERKFICSACETVRQTKLATYEANRNHPVD